jgi:hypothetical protein
MRREGLARAGLDYFLEIKDREDLPPRLLFAPKSLIGRFLPEIEELVENFPNRYLPPATSSQEFFKTVFENLGQTSSPAAKPS